MDLRARSPSLLTQYRDKSLSEPPLSLVLLVLTMDLLQHMAML